MAAPVPAYTGICAWHLNNPKEQAPITIGAQSRRIPTSRREEADNFLSWPGIGVAGRPLSSANERRAGVKELVGYPTL